MDRLLAVEAYGASSSEGWTVFVGVFAATHTVGDRDQWPNHPRNYANQGFGPWVSNGVCRRGTQSKCHGLGPTRVAHWCLADVFNDTGHLKWLPATVSRTRWKHQKMWEPGLNFYSTTASISKHALEENSVVTPSVS